ncbi:hypothetical protein [Pedobacter sp. NJ-S-72]
MSVSAAVQNSQSGDQLKISILDGTSIVGEEKVAVNTTAEISVKNEKLWSPEHPFLYDLKITLLRKGKPVDEIKSYFAMRKISMGPDAKGIQRMLLNNKFVFQYGPLDQGWWPDGLYTAPTEEAMVYDIDELKKMGF